eukprot:15438417-Alexandrium_andersonii.AAC.1
MSATALAWRLAPRQAPPTCHRAAVPSGPCGSSPAASRPGAPAARGRTPCTGSCPSCDAQVRTGCRTTAVSPDGNPAGCPVSRPARSARP